MAQNKGTIPGGITPSGAAKASSRGKQPAIPKTNPRQPTTKSGKSPTSSPSSQKKTGTKPSSASTSADTPLINPVKRYPAVRVSSNLLLSDLTQGPRKYMDFILDFNEENFWRRYSKEITPKQTSTVNRIHLRERIDPALNGLTPLVEYALSEGTGCILVFSYKAKESIVLELVDANSIKLSTSSSVNGKNPHVLIHLKVDEKKSVPVCQINTIRTINFGESVDEFERSFVTLSFLVFIARWILFIVSKGKSVLVCHAISGTKKYPFAAGTSEDQDDVLETLSQQKKAVDLEWEIFTAGAGDKDGYLSRFANTDEKDYVTPDYARTGIVLVLTERPEEFAGDVSKYAHQMILEELKSVKGNELLSGLIDKVSDSNPEFVVGNLPTDSRITAKDVKEIKELLNVQVSQAELEVPVSIEAEYYERATELLLPRVENFVAPEILSSKSTAVTDIPRGVSQDVLEETYGFKSLRLPVTRYKQNFLHKVTVDYTMLKDRKKSNIDFINYFIEQRNDARDTEESAMEEDTGESGQTSIFTNSTIPASISLSKGDFPSNAAETGVQTFYKSHSNLRNYSTEEGKIGLRARKGKDTGKIVLDEKSLAMIRDFTPMELEMCMVRFSDRFYQDELEEVKAELENPNYVKPSKRSRKPTVPKKPQPERKQNVPTPNPQSVPTGDVTMVDVMDISMDDEIERLIAEGTKATVGDTEEVNPEEPEFQGVVTSKKTKKDRRPFIIFKRDIYTAGDLVDFEECVNMYVAFEPDLRSKKEMFGTKAKMLYFFIGRFNPKAWVSVDIPAEILVANNKGNAQKLFALTDNGDIIDESDILSFFCMPSSQYSMSKVLIEHFFRNVLDPGFRIIDFLSQKVSESALPVTPSRIPKTLSGAVGTLKSRPVETQYIAAKSEETPKKPVLTGQGNYGLWHTFEGSRHTDNISNESQRHTFNGVLGEYVQIEPVVKSVHVLQSINAPLLQIINELRGATTKSIGYGRAKNEINPAISQLAYKWEITKITSTYRVQIIYTFDDNPTSQTSSNVDQTVIPPKLYSGNENYRPPLNLTVEFLINTKFLGSQKLGDVELPKPPDPGSVVLACLKFFESVDVNMSGYVRMIQGTSENVDNNLRVSTSRDFYDVVQYLYSYFQRSIIRGKGALELNVLGRALDKQMDFVNLIETVITVDLRGLEPPLLSTKSVKIRAGQEEVLSIALKNNLEKLDFFNLLETVSKRPAPFVEFIKIQPYFLEGDQIVLVRQKSPFDGFFKTVVFVYVYFSQRNDENEKNYSNPNENRLHESLKSVSSVVDPKNPAAKPKTEINHVTTLRKVKEKCSLVATILDDWVMIYPPKSIHRFPDTRQVVTVTGESKYRPAESEFEELIETRKANDYLLRKKYGEDVAFLSYLHDQPDTPILTRKTPQNHRFPSTLLAVIFEKLFGLKVEDMTNLSPKTSVHRIAFEFDINGMEKESFAKKQSSKTAPRALEEGISSAEKQRELNEKYGSQGPEKLIAAPQDRPIFFNLFDPRANPSPSRDVWFDYDLKTSPQIGRICVVPNTDLDLRGLGISVKGGPGGASLNTAPIWDVLMPPSVFNNDEIQTNYAQTLALKIDSKKLQIGSMRKDSSVGLQGAETIIMAREFTDKNIRNQIPAKLTKKELDSMTELEQEKAKKTYEMERSKAITLAKVYAKYAIIAIRFTKPGDVQDQSPDGLFGFKFGAFWTFTRALRTFELPFYFSTTTNQNTWRLFVPDVLYTYYNNPGQDVLDPSKLQQRLKNAKELPGKTQTVDISSIPNEKGGYNVLELDLDIFRQKTESDKFLKQKEHDATIKLIRGLLEAVLPFYLCIPSYKDKQIKFAPGSIGQKIEDKLALFDFPELPREIQRAMKSIWVDNYVDNPENSSVTISPSFEELSPNLLDQLENTLVGQITKPLGSFLARLVPSEKILEEEESDKDESEGDDSDGNMSSDSSDDSGGEESTLVYAAPKSYNTRSHTVSLLDKKPGPTGEEPGLLSKRPGPTGKEPVAKKIRIGSRMGASYRDKPILCKSCNRVAKYYCDDCGPIHSYTCHDGYCGPRHRHIDHSETTTLLRIGDSFIKRTEDKTKKVLRQINPVTFLSKRQEKNLRKREST